MLLGKTKNSLKFWSMFFTALVFSSSTCWGADDQEESSSSSVTVNLASAEKEEMTPISEDDVKKHPYNAIVYLTAHFNTSTTERGFFSTEGVGFFVDDNVLSTAAHLVFDQGIEATQIFCRKGRHGTASEIRMQVKKYAYPIEYYEASRAWKEYKHKNNIDTPDGIMTEAMMMHDYAFLYLGKRIKLFNRIEPVLYNESFSPPFKLFGYPGEGYHVVKMRKESLPWPLGTFASFPYECIVSPKLEKKNDDLMACEMRSYSGMSGGPVGVSKIDPKNGETTWQAFAIGSGRSDTLPYTTFYCLLTEQKMHRLIKLKDYITKLKDNDSTYAALGVVVRTCYETHDFFCNREDYIDGSLNKLLQFGSSVSVESDSGSDQLLSTASESESEANLDELSDAL